MEIIHDMEILNDIKQDINVLVKSLKDIDTKWDGKESILKLREANYNWKQMEWWSFYFEHLIFNLIKNTIIKHPGEKFGNVVFDLKGCINWDIKATAIKSDNHCSILNDKIATKMSLNKYGYHGAIIGLCDVEYNDENRTFQKWHSELKGGYQDTN